jgi:hypothetical protein
MMRVRLQRLLSVGVLVLLATSTGQADGPTRFHASGSIEDVTVPSAGAWVIHGKWSLDTKEDRNGEFSNADFSAVMTMERSDYYLVVNPALDPESLATRNAHTHHITLADAVVTPIAGGFRLTGPATVTANGALAPFGASTLEVDIVGASVVSFSNLKLTFGGGAATHFGSQPLSGAVQKSK